MFHASENRLLVKQCVPYTLWLLMIFKNKWQKTANKQNNNQTWRKLETKTHQQKGRRRNKHVYTATRTTSNSSFVLVCHSGHRCRLFYGKHQDGKINFTKLNTFPFPQASKSFLVFFFPFLILWTNNLPLWIIN